LAPWAHSTHFGAPAVASRHTGVLPSHVVELTHLPFASQVCTVVLEHRLVPGTHSPPQAPVALSQMKGQPCAVPHVAVESHTRTSLPETHSELNGVHSPPQSPSVQMNSHGVSGLVSQEMPSQVTTTGSSAVPAHWVSPTVHAPTHTPPSQSPGQVLWSAH